MQAIVPILLACNAVHAVAGAAAITHTALRNDAALGLSIMLQV